MTLSKVDQYELAQITGHEGVQSEAKAVELYLEAAKEGGMEAQAALSRMYEDGKGVTQSYFEAYKWMWLASVNSEQVEWELDGEELTDDYVGMADYFGTYLSAEDLKKAKAEADEFFC